MMMEFLISSSVYGYIINVFAVSWKLHLKIMPSERTLTSSVTRTRAHLPACRVCYGTADGVHYGVITCQPCKVFFRRKRSSHQFLKCVRKGKCNIDSSLRPNCSKCRYQKCLFVGMSENAVIKGRYSSARKMNYAIEKRRNDSVLSQFGTDLMYHELVNPDELIQTLLDAHARCVQSLHYTSGPTPLYILRCHTKQMLSPEEIQDDIGNKAHQYVTFVKMIPESLQMSPVDLLQVMKNGFFEFFILENYPGIDDDAEVLNSSMTTFFHRNELNTLFGKALVDELFSFATKLKQLNLSLEEVVLVEVICTLSADRCGLENPKIVDHLQWRVVETLIHHLHRASGQPLSRFSKILDCITGMRTLSEMYYNTRE